ncbi:MAG TPA: hypothetical protein VG733_09780 [Chthoniobacteraceae bacterium]|nr:hypothetical protein [Chthoniobacteraceae bacterium]
MHVDKTILSNLKRDRDVVAAALSVVPGLGHIYKGYYAVGLAILVLGAPLMIWIGVLLSLATIGVGLITPAIAWGLVATDAYYRKNRRRHHWFGVL